MSELIDQLGELTAYRDREILDVTLAGALREILPGASVTVYRCIGEPGNERWSMRARLADGDAVAVSDPVWAELDSLPPLAANPSRHRAYTEQRTVAVASPAPTAYFPVVTERDAVGVVEIGGPRALEPEVERLVSGVLRIFRNFQSLLDYSERDTLTGLLNRKTFDMSFMKAAAVPADAGAAACSAAAEERRAPRQAGGHWLALIDIDHFKRVNDGYGHMIGDEVLLLLARLMRGSFRFHDQLYRFGGEEFLVLMRCQGGDDAKLALERLRQRTEQFVFPQVGRITISVGYTDVRAGDTPNAAFERADKAVYHAKGHGRNQVIGHAGLLESGELAPRQNDSDIELF